MNPRQRHPIALLAGTLAIAAALLAVIGGAIVALNDDAYDSAEYFRDVVLSGFVLAAACYALRHHDHDHDHATPTRSRTDVGGTTLHATDVER